MTPVNRDAISNRRTSRFKFHGSVLIGLQRQQWYTAVGCQSIHQEDLGCGVTAVECSESPSLLTCCLLKSKSTMSEEIGRRAILAVDREDILALIQLFDKTDHDINATTTSTGYLSYQWTPWIAQFLGDTLLHIALKKHKVLSSNTLLLLNANVNSTNYFKETTDSICRSKFGYSIHQMKTNAANNILPHIRLSDSKKLACILPNIESLRRETLNFIDYGRLKNTVMDMASSEAIQENIKDIVEGIKRSSMQSNKRISTLTN